MRGHKPWAVLARLVLAERPVGRRGLSSELFPDADDPLGSLRWCLAGLRRALGDATLFTGDPIDVRLPPSISVDVHGIGPGDLDELLDGELIEGIDPAGGPELATWLLVARRQVAARVDAVLRDEVIASLSHGRTAACPVARRAGRPSIALRRGRARAARPVPRAGRRSRGRRPTRGGGRATVPGRPRLRPVASAAETRRARRSPPLPLA